MSQKVEKISATTLAKKANRSGDTLYRLEKGEEVTTEARMDILHAMQYTVHLSSSNFSTLSEMRDRFSEDGDD